MLEYCGFRPQAQDESAPTLSLDRLLIRSSSTTFFARMSGNAMLCAGIRHGDILVIEAAKAYGHDAIVCAFINYEAVVRRLEHTGTGYALVASDPKFPTQVVTEDCVIRGQVVAAVTLLARPRLPLPVVS